MNRLSCLGVAAGLALAVVSSLGAPASATTQERGTVIHQETADAEHHFLVEDSCDVPGLTTQVDIVTHGTIVYRAVGRDRLPYASGHWVSDYRFTNVANGRYVTIDEDIWGDDIHVRDNGDGTNSGLRVGRNYSEMHDALGRKLEYNSTWTLSRWTNTNGGTPRDPRDDEEIDWVDLRQLGHVADYCAATVAAVSDPGQASRSRGNAGRRTLAPRTEDRLIAPGGRP